MLELARLIGTPPERIILQTRKRRDVANIQSCEPDERTRTFYQRFRVPHLSWKNRKDACGIYNCFGLVWANRRTSIYGEDDFKNILADDGYRLLTTEGQLQPGDIVIYLSRNANNLRNTLHVGIVLNFDQIGLTRVPWVLSKWSDQYGEDIHKLKDVPEQYGDYLIELWTDRL